MRRSPHRFILATAVRGSQDKRPRTLFVADFVRIERSGRDGGDARRCSELQRRARERDESHIALGKWRARRMAPAAIRAFIVA